MNHTMKRVIYLYSALLDAETQRRDMISRSLLYDLRSVVCDLISTNVPHVRVRASVAIILIEKSMSPEKYY